MHIFKNTNFDFLRWRWHAIALSWAIIIAGIVTLATKGIPKGVEFAGGTVLIEKFDQSVSVQQVREALDRNYPGGGQNTVVQAVGDPGLRMVMIRVPQVGSETGASLTVEAKKVEDALDKANLGKRSREGAEVVGTIHDLLITLAFLAFFRYDMSLNVIAAILTMTGFSTNDTIVIFDRIRDNLRGMRRDSMHHIINASINQTLSRTIITSGTALLTALALFFFGGEVLHGFAFTMIVGIITGTYSSVFIAAAIVSLWRGRVRGAGAVSKSAPET